MMQMSRRHVNMMTSAAASVVSSSCANIAFSLDAIIVASIIICALVRLAVVRVSVVVSVVVALVAICVLVLSDLHVPRMRTRI